MKKEDILNQYNNNFNEHFKSIEDVEQYLTDKFQNYIDKSEDIQLAYNDMNEDMNGFLNKYFVYSISGDGCWSISTSENYKIEDLHELLSNWNSYYEDSLTSLDELMSSIERRVEKDMDNVGCDPFNALNMLSADVGLKDAFIIDGAAEKPTIKFSSI